MANKLQTTSNLFSSGLLVTSRKLNFTFEQTWNECFQPSDFVRQQMLSVLWLLTLVDPLVWMHPEPREKKTEAKRILCVKLGNIVHMARFEASFFLEFLS